MRRMASLLSIVPVALGLALAGCDNVQNMTSVGDQVAPQYVRKNSSSPRRLAATLTQGGAKDATIDANGGSIIIKNTAGDDIAMLVVPAGTVKNGTVFTMSVDEDFTVELTATSARSRSANDVGAAGFKKGVQLWINTTYIAAPSTTLFGVAELKPSGALVSVPSFRSGNWVGGILRHFSAYVPVEDDGTYVPISD